MVNTKGTPKIVKVGGTLFEELAFKHIKDKYGISKTELLRLVTEKTDKEKTLPISILRVTKLSSLESIVKFLRENRRLSYKVIGKLLCRNSRTLAVTYNVACRKMTENFSDDVDDDVQRLPFEVFSRKLSILESICTYMRSQGKSYADIARDIGKDQRTVWTVCKRAENKKKGYGRESK